MLSLDGLLHQPLLHQPFPPQVYRKVESPSRQRRRARRAAAQAAKAANTTNTEAVEAAKAKEAAEEVDDEENVDGKVCDIAEEASIPSAKVTDDSIEDLIDEFCSDEEFLGKVQRFLS